MDLPNKKVPLAVLVRSTKLGYVRFWSKWLFTGSQPKFYTAGAFVLRCACAPTRAKGDKAKKPPKAKVLPARCPLDGSQVLRTSLHALNANCQRSERANASAANEQMRQRRGALLVLRVKRPALEVRPK
jgi:hypothetical protein